MPMAPPPPPHDMTISDGPPTYSAVLYAPPPPPFPQLGPGPSVDPTPARQNAQEQEMEDGEEESQWPIRIAADTPAPPWAVKRRADDDEDGKPAKKARLE